MNLSPRAPTRVLSLQEMRALDAATSAEFGVSSLVLMENAGRAVAERARRMLKRGHKVVVVCGPGNNGGDGFVAARHLANSGVHVEVLLISETAKGDALTNLEAYRKLGGSPRLFNGDVEAGLGDVVVDALFGIGLSRPPEGIAKAAIEGIVLARGRGAKVLAVDMPSGLATDNGKPFGVCVEADVTLSLGYLKRGIVLEPGCSLSGEVEVADISIPRLAESRLKERPVLMLTEPGVRAMLPRRDADTHKMNYGHVLVLAGSPGKTGAASMTAAAALRGGAGLVTLCGREADVHLAQRYMPELMSSVLPGAGPLTLADLPALLEACKGKTVIAAGPGLYRGPETGALLMKMLEQTKLPAVLDADALNALAEADADLKGSLQAPVILTPHPGEMARLTKLSTAQVQDDRLGVARRYADQHRVTVVLKGARTIVADASGATVVNPTGNAGMATAGSGDVLTGLTAAFLAQRLTPGSAACAAVYVHGLAGDRVRKERGRPGLVATDLIDGATRVFAEWGL